MAAETDAVRQRRCGRVKWYQQRCRARLSITQPRRPTEPFARAHAGLTKRVMHIGVGKADDEIGTDSTDYADSRIVKFKRLVHSD